MTAPGNPQTAPPEERRIWAEIMTLLLSFGGVFLLSYFVPYSEGHGSVRVPLFEQWNNLVSGGGEWQHCYLVIPIVIGVVIHSIRNRPLPENSSSIPGLCLLILSFCLFWVGYKMSTHYIGFFAIQGILAGSIGFLLGWRFIVYLSFPLIFLIFAWPLPFLDYVVAFPLRMIMSHASAIVLNGIGVPVLLNGTGILSAPNPLLGIPAGKTFSVDVADPCSGIRSLFALMMVSALYGHFTLRTWWQKLILFGSSVPLAVLGNLARILILTLGTIVFGSEFAIGKDALNDPSWFHMGAGYLVFVVALAGMVGLSGLLQLDLSELKSRWSTIRPAGQPPKDTTNSRPSDQSFSPKKDEDIY